jgi:hypothetical protein
MYDVEVSPVMDALVMVVDRHAWSGTATGLLDAMATAVPGSQLPASPSALSRELRVWSEIIEAIGVRITFSREGHESRKIIRLERLAGGR